MSHPWSPAAWTGLGPMPGDDVVAATRTAFEAGPDLPFVPWLPGAGLGADFAGRGAALLIDLHVDLQPSGWRLVPRPGVDERRARDALVRSLDALEEAAGDWAGPVKVSVPGPWTLAASLELARGEKVLADAGAVRDLAAALAEGVVVHQRAVRRALPGTTDVVVQLDEPLLPLVLAGRIATQSGWSAHPAIEAPIAETHLAVVLAACDAGGGVRVARGPVPVAVLQRAGAAWVGFDAIDAAAADLDLDALGEAIEGGLGLFLGLVPPGDGDGRDVRDVRALAAPGQRLWSQLGFAADALRRTVVVTPTDGVELIAPSAVASVLRRCAEVADALQESAGST